MDDISIIGQLNYRNDRRLFGIKQTDRLSHMYIIGKTGTGKTTLMQNLIKQDIAAGRGCAVLDPHGDMVDVVAQNVPADLKDRLIYFNVPDPNLEWGYNPLAYVSEERRPLLASGIMEIFKKQWDGNSWGVRMEHILRNSLLTLLEQPEATLGDIARLYSDNTYRYKCLKNVRNQRVLDFWTKEFAKYSYRLKAEAVIPIQNKLSGFLSNPTLYRILCTSDKRLRLRSIMDEGKFLMVNLAKGQIGEDAANLLGGLILTSLGLAAYSRSDVPEEQRRPFFVYGDEFQNFTTLSSASMMAELRKYGVGLILANQYLHQLNNDVRDAVIGNAGSLICFRLGAQDAGYFEKELFSKFSAEDLAVLPNYMMYAKLMINGMPSLGFSGGSMIPEATSYTSRS